MLAPRRPITTAARIIVPVNAAFAVAVGLIYAFQDQPRTSRILEGFHQIGLSDHRAGWVLVALGVVILAGIVTGFVEVAAVGCLAAGVAWLAVAVTMLHPDSTQSWSGVLWPVYVGLVHLVSTVALMTRGE
jgi:hypothetical protein